MQASPGGFPAPLRLARAAPILLLAAVVASALRLSGDLQRRILAATGPQPLPQSALLPALFTLEVQRWAPEIEGWAEVYEVPAPLIATVMQIESCGDARAESAAGAQGLFQVMPFHFTPGEAPLDPETNAQRGLAYLARALDLAGGRVDLALAGYNGGHSRITQPADLWPEETRRYVAWGTAIYADAAAGRDQSQTLQAWLTAGGARLCLAAASASQPTT